MNEETFTIREALLAQALGDLDNLVSRLESLPETIATAEQALAKTAAQMKGADDNYRMAVTSFTEQAKQSLAEFMDNKASQVISKTSEEQRAAMQEAARLVFRSEAADKIADITAALEKGVNRPISVLHNLTGYVLTALLSSALTAVLIALLKFKII